MIQSKTIGLIAAPYTPFSLNGEINPEIISLYAARLKANDLKGVFICGSTGETASLTVEERKIIAEKWLEFQDDDFKVFVHVGTNSVKDGAALASHAEEFGAYAIAATGPSYFKPGSVQQLLEFMKEVAAAAPKTPYYYYHIPGLNQNNFSTVEFLNLAFNDIPTLAGMKYTHEDEMEFQLSREVGGGKLDILYGRDETLICGLILGATGGVGSTYNFAPELYYEIIRNFNNGNFKKANELQLISMKLVQIYGKYGACGIPVGKLIMKRLGLDLGSPRLPFSALTRDEEEIVIKALEEISFFSYALKE